MGESESQTGLFPWPDWLEERRVPDATLAAAYDSFPAKYRAALKTGLALASFHFGQDPGRECSRLLSEHAGFWKSSSTRPADRAIIVMEPGYRAAALLAAACVLPILADVRQICAISLNAAPAPQALLCLELCGIEDIFQINGSAFSALLSALRPAGTGRMVILHNGELEFAVNAARDARIPCHEQGHSPNVLVLDPDLFDTDLLEFCLAFNPAARTPEARLPLDAIYAGNAAIKSRSGMEEEKPEEAWLNLCPGCEGFWIFPGLGPDFFRVKNFSLGLLQDHP